MQDVENSFGSNICRCTGYRSILTAFKSLASDVDTEIVGEFPDIEDFEENCKTDKRCIDKCKMRCRKLMMQPAITTNKSKWYKVYNVEEIFDIFKMNPEGRYMLVGGHTARGGIFLQFESLCSMSSFPLACISGVYYQTSAPDFYVDITSVPSLINHSLTNDGLVLGANTTLSQAISIFRKISSQFPDFSYLSEVGEHFSLVAHVPVRSVSSTHATKINISFFVSLDRNVSWESEYQVRTQRFSV